MDGTLEADLEHVRALLTATTAYLDELEIYPRSRGIFLDAVLLAILSKSLRVADAVCLLVECGFHSEAFGLSRTMLELALFARYISNKDSFSRSEIFAKYFAKDLEGWTKLISKYYPNAVARFHPNHNKLLEIAKQFKDPHRWSGKSVRDLAIEEDTFETLPNGQPFRWEFDYEVVYKWTSHYVHGTVVAVDEHATAPRQPFRVKKPANLGKADMALFNSALYLYRAVIATFRAVNHEASQAIIDRFEAVLKELAH
jgi:hypothetical protein